MPKTPTSKTTLKHARWPSTKRLAGGVIPGHTFFLSIVRKKGRLDAIAKITNSKYPAKLSFAYLIS